MTERVHRHFPTKYDFPEKIDFCGLHYDDTGYRIYVSEFPEDKGFLFEIFFESGFLAQRSMDEGKYLATSWRVNEQDGPVGSVVIVEGSDFVDWFQEQSCGIYKNDEVKHIAVLTQSEWIEVICLEFPIINKINR